MDYKFYTIIAVAVDTRAVIAGPFPKLMPNDIFLHLVNIRVSSILGESTKPGLYKVLLKITPDEAELYKVEAIDYKKISYDKLMTC